MGNYVSVGGNQFDLANYGISESNADNSPALQALINNTAGLKKIKFSSGVFNFLSPVVINRDVLIEGDGSALTNLHFTWMGATNTFANLASFPSTGNAGQTYLATDTQLVYRWDGSSYFLLGSNTGLFAFDATSRQPQFCRLRIISTTGRNYTNDSVEKTLIPDGRNFGGIRVARESLTPAFDSSVTGRIIDDVSLEGFSGLFFSGHKLIKADVKLKECRYGLGVLFTNHKNALTNPAHVSTTIKYSGYVTVASQGVTFTNCVDVTLDQAIAEYNGQSDGTFGGFTFNNCRNVLLNQPYAEANVGDNIKAIDSRITCIQPDFYQPTTSTRTNIVPTFSGTAWQDRASTLLDPFGLNILTRGGNTWASVALHYAGGANNTLLGLGYNDGNGIRTIRTHSERNQQQESRITTTTSGTATLWSFQLADANIAPSRINVIDASVRIIVWDITDQSAGTPEILVASFLVECGARRRVLGTDQIGTATITTLKNNTSLTTSNLAVTTGSGQLRINVTGLASRTLIWQAFANTTTYMAPMESGTASAGNFNSLTDSTKTWTTNQWTNWRIRILSGTGAGQTRLISGNTGTVISVRDVWVTAPNNTSVYEIGAF